MFGPAALVSLQKRVRRGPFLAWGFGLAALKFAIDTALVYGFTGKTWSPLGYVVPSVVLRQSAVGDAPGALHVLLALFALPFLWIGVSMSVRRAADAGVSPWWGAGFLVPVVNYLVILALSVLPSKAEARWEPSPVLPYRGPARTHDAPPPSTVELPPSLKSTLLGMFAPVGLGMSILGLAVYGLGAYGTVLFFATPFAMGAVSASLYNAGGLRPLGKTIGVAVSAVAMTGCAVLLFALEGVLCLAMAFPLAALVAAAGAATAWVIRSSSGVHRREVGLLVMLPLGAVGEAHAARPELADVTTSIEIDAPPDRVWPNVVGFSELPPAPEWFFRLGIAHPQRARIEGSGVGAVRRCEFSTGAFVEPITVWDEPRRLAFDVTSQPPSMAEWSPYQRVNAPHLEGYMVSKGGEFRLIALPGGRTRLEGTTHYTLAIYPATYWRPFAEGLLHAIHHRVLAHVKGLSERG
jgi:uncharacterized membrane protein YhaH (DUF805 family)